MGFLKFRKWKWPYLPAWLQHVKSSILDMAYQTYSSPMMNLSWRHRCSMHLQEGGSLNIERRARTITNQTAAQKMLSKRAWTWWRKRNRNTPPEGTGSSPVQRSMGRRTWTLLVIMSPGPNLWYNHHQCYHVVLIVDAPRPCGIRTITWTDILKLWTLNYVSFCAVVFCSFIVLILWRGGCGDVALHILHGSRHVSFHGYYI